MFHGSILVVSFPPCSFVDPDGFTPLCHAAKNGKDEIVGYLLDVKKVPIKINEVCSLCIILKCNYSVL